MLTLLTAQAAAKAETLSGHSVNLERIIDQLTNWSIEAGKNIIAAIIVFIVGRYLIQLINRLMGKMLERRKIEATIQSFLKSFINILLTILLIVSVVGALGVNTTSFAALLASAGVAVGMALSGNLQNLAGGLIILLFKPYRVGDWVEAQGTAGTVREIQIFHTILTTADNKEVFVPNGAMSSGVITNYTRNDTRRLEWVVGVEYGEDMEKVRTVVEKLLKEDKRILSTPAPVVALHTLNASSVDVTIRAWVNLSDYWDVHFSMNQRIYETFNQEGIGFPFPQLTIHRS